MAHAARQERATAVGTEYCSDHASYLQPLPKRDPSLTRLARLFKCRVLYLWLHLR